MFPNLCTHQCNNWDADVFFDHNWHLTAPAHTRTFLLSSVGLSTRDKRSHHTIRKVSKFVITSDLVAAVWVFLRFNISYFDRVNQ